MIAYALIAVLGAVTLWLALELHKAKEERDDALTRLCESQADAETGDWYAKRALVAEARVRELEAILGIAKPVSVPSCWVSQTTYPSGTVTIGGTADGFTVNAAGDVQ